MRASSGGKVEHDQQQKKKIRETVDSLLGAVSEADRVLLLMKEVEGYPYGRLEKIYRVKENALRSVYSGRGQTGLEGLRNGGAEERERLRPLEQTAGPLEQRSDVPNAWRRRQTGSLLQVYRAACPDRSQRQFHARPVAADRIAAELHVFLSAHGARLVTAAAAVTLAIESTCPCRAPGQLPK